MQEWMGANVRAWMRAEYSIRSTPVPPDVVASSAVDAMYYIAKPPIDSHTARTMRHATCSMQHAACSIHHGHAALQDGNGQQHRKVAEQMSNGATRAWAASSNIAITLELRGSHARVRARACWPLPVRGGAG